MFNMFNHDNFSPKIIFCSKFDALDVCVGERVHVKEPPDHEPKV